MSRGNGYRNVLKQRTSAQGLVVILTLVFFISSLQSSAKAQQPGDANQPALIGSTDYQVGPGDIIDVVVARNEALSRSGVRVNNEGRIQLPMLDESISAACLTERELADRLKEKYKKYLLRPFVYVAVKEFNSKPVALIGAVMTPGRFQLQRSVRLLELLTFVSGPSNNAGRTIQIIRDSNFSRCEEKILRQTTAAAKEEIVFYTLADTLQGKDSANPFVQPGDIIRVVEADQAYIIGNVKSAATINLNEPVMLTEAIARAGGVAPDSDIEKIRLRRQNKDLILVNLKDINKRLADDIALQANDIVEVPGEGGSKKFFKDLYRTVIPSVMSFPTRVIR